MDHAVIVRVFGFLAPSVNVTCAYTCEIAAKKQEFLCDVVHHDDLSCCFKDVTQMGGLKAECCRHKTEDGCTVPTDEQGPHFLAILGFQAPRESTPEHS